MRLTKTRKFAACCAMFTFTSLGIWGEMINAERRFAEPAKDQQRGIETLRDTSRGFSYAAKKATPAVVSISSASEATLRSNRLFRNDQSDPSNEELLFRFFGLPFAPPQERQPPRSFASGFLISADGYILTNNHVVRDVEEIFVTLPDETEHKATIVGRDPDTDLAVIKIDGRQDLPYLQLGNSDALEIGDWVIAIGNPGMLRSTLTVGVVSAKGRDNLNINVIEGYIQTDAAINPGNSGGPLLNIDGEVIGVNTAIATNTGSHIGFGFAIPSNIANQISQQIIKSGTVRRVMLGVQLERVNKDVAEFNGLKNAEGFAIVQIVEGSPAEKAGFKLGDIILAVDGQPMRDFQTLRSFLSMKEPGTTVRVMIFRSKAMITIPVTLEVDSDRVSASMASKAFGIELENAKFSTGVVKEGVRIKSIEANSPAYAAKVRPGVTLIAIDNEPVKSVADCKPLLDQAVSAGKVLLLLREGHITRNVVLKARG